ncbi:NUDIX domain-containing protein [Mesonia aquimarina]|uniref:NUDIX domain-containing protein n=1 Tax=Mesonia aquimarina TaxID=1504967 RepID=UPI000EF5A0DA|nr:NUDIX hydrolase [Mesonia aquimarina]
MKQNIALTVDAVVISSAENYAVLLIKRKNNPYKDHWALPGGFVESDEKLHDACKRELEEETSLRVKTLEFVSFYDEIDRDPRGRTITAAYSTIIPIQPKVKAADDANEAKWFKVNELDEVNLAFDHFKIIQDSLKKLKISSS